MKNIPTSPRILDMKRKRRAHHIRLSIFIFILLVSIIYALGYFSSNSRITINKIVVTGASIINPQDIESVVRDNLSGDYLHIFYKGNSFIYPKNTIYQELINKFPRIKELSISLDNINTIHISIVERSGSSLYCGMDVPQLASSIGENCYFINNNGYIFSKAPYFSGNIYFKYYGTLPNGVTDPLGVQIFSSDTFHKLSRFVDGVTGLGFKPSYMITSSDDDLLYLEHGANDTTPEITFKNDSDLDTILSNLSLAMTKPEFANEINSKYTTLLYIDLRFNNKVLYKFK